jgi:DNA polymerase elongation subunit (family B)
MKYDLPYISNRFKKIYIKSTGRGMELPFMQIQYVDVLAYWRKLSQTVGLSKEVKKAQSGGLDDVAKAVLGQGKFAKVTGSEINEWFEHDRGKLKDYNMQDARLVKELDGKNGYPLSEHYITLATNFGVMIKDSDKNNTMHTQLAMKICRKRNPPLVLPEPPHKKVTYTGAYCGEVPQPMVYENVGVGDLKSTYPNVIKTFMLSPEVRQLFLRWKDSGMDMKEFVRQVVVGA